MEPRSPRTGRRQFGSVRKLPSGRWQVRYRDRIGASITAPQTFPTKSEAGRYLAMVEADLARGTYLDPRGGRITLGAWAEERLGRPGKRAHSVARDRQALEEFGRTLGSMPLAAITPMHVQSVVDQRSQVAKPSTVARDFSALRAALNAAVDADLIGRSPARRVRLPRVERVERQGLSPEELARLAGAVPPRYRALVLTAGVLGLRWGESVALRLRDVDFLRRTLTVAQTVEELAGHVRIVSDAKTRQSLRTLAVPPFLIEEIARHITSFRSDDSSDLDALVFVGPRGAILRRNFCARILRPALVRAGLDPTRTFHWLRHDALSALVDVNVHPRVMQGRAGHATAKLTLERYSHVSDAADRGAADALEARFAPVMGGSSQSPAESPDRKVN